MSPSTPLPRTLARLAALLVGVVTAGLVGLPSAHADTVTKSLMLLPGQSGSIGTVASNTDVTPVSSCDPELSVTFDATMEGTVTVAQDATLGLYTCMIDFQVSGQSVGLFEQVLVTVGPGLSINDVTVMEGNVLTTSATFTVTLSAASANTVSVNVTTSNGTANAPSDYTAVKTTVIFQPGETSRTVPVSINGDSQREADETYSVNLSKPTNALIADGQGTGFIMDDDGGPAIATQ